MTFIHSLFEKVSNTDNKLFSQLFRHTPSPTILTDEHGIILFVNERFCNITGYCIDELEGEKISRLKSGEQNHAFYTNMWQELLQNDHFEGELWNRNKNQSLKLYKVIISKMSYQKKNYFIATYDDITEEKKLYKRFQYLATHDSLTGLANRTLVKDRFSHALLNALRANEKVGVLLCDLNEFKHINDNYGHKIGDMLLKDTADKLTQYVRKGDTVARFGGDEFLLILERLESDEELKKLVKKLDNKLNVSINNDGIRIDVGMSIGHACFPNDGTTYEQLLEIADLRMYDQKKQHYGH